jgi:hypothetical protein
MQLAQEANSIPRRYGFGRAAQVSGVQDQKRTNDEIATGVAIVVFRASAPGLFLCLRARVALKLKGVAAVNPT